MPFSLDPQPAENEIECARCGAHVYIGLSRCPECGVNLFEPEDEIDPYTLAGEANPRGGLGSIIRDVFRRLFGKL